MAKSPSASAERQQLAVAHQQLIEAQAALAEAEAEYQMALRDYHGATGTVSDIEAQIRQTKETRTYGLPNLKEEVNDKLRIAYSQKLNAERAVGPFGAAEQEARRVLTQARYPALNGQTAVARAAEAVVKVEADPVARECLSHVLAAFEIIATWGPDLLVLTHKKLAAPDIVAAVEGAAGGLLGKAVTGWPEFESRWKRSPWRAAVEMLQQDASAALPSAPAP